VPIAYENAACWCVQAGLWCSVRESQLQRQGVPFTSTPLISENFHRQYSSNLHRVCTYFFQKHALTLSSDNNAAFFSNKKARISYVGGAALIKLNFADIIWVIKEFIFALRAVKWQLRGAVIRSIEGGRRSRCVSSDGPNLRPHDCLHSTPFGYVLKAAFLDYLDNIIVSERYYSVYVMVTFMTLRQPLDKDNDDSE